MFINGWLIVILISLVLKYVMIKNDLNISKFKFLIVLVLTIFFGIIGSIIWAVFILEEISYKKKSGN